MKNKISIIPLFLIVVIFISSPKINAQLVTKKTVSLELAKKLATAAEEQAIKDN